MDMLTLYILYLILFFFFVMNQKKIYANMTKDEKFVHIKTFKKIISLGFALELMSFISYIIDSSIEKTIKNIGDFSYTFFVLGNLTIVYGLEYITNKKRFPNAMKSDLIEKIVIYSIIFFLFILAFGVYCILN